jgi:hypothetical protein
LNNIIAVGKKQTGSGALEGTLGLRKQSSDAYLGGNISWASKDCSVLLDRLAILGNPKVTDIPGGSILLKLIGIA